MYKHVSGRPEAAAASRWLELRCSSQPGESRAGIVFALLARRSASWLSSLVKAPQSAFGSPPPPSFFYFILFFSLCWSVRPLFVCMLRMIRRFRCNDCSVRVGDIMTCGDHRVRLRPPLRRWRCHVQVFTTRELILPPAHVRLFLMSPRRSGRFLRTFSFCITYVS